MAVTKSVIAVLAVLVAAAAAQTGTLYGLSAKVGLIEVDPTTGTITPIGAPLPQEAQAQNLACIDAEHGYYYFIGFNLTTQASYLLGLNLTSAAIEVNVKLPFAPEPLIGVGQAVDVDPTNGEVFVTGLLQDNLHHLYRVNPRTGALKYLAKIGDINVLGGAHGYDMANEIVWLQYGVNHTTYVSLDLFGFDARNGGQKYHYPQDPINFISTLDFDIQNNRMVGFGYNVNTSKRTIVGFDSTSGKLDQIAAVDGYLIINGDIATVNSKGGEIFGMFQPVGNSSAPFELLTVDIATGTIKNHVNVCAQPAMCPWSLEFAPDRS